jgi:hypothetical protein
MIRFPFKPRSRRVSSPDSKKRGFAETILGYLKFRMSLTHFLPRSRERDLYDLFPKVDRKENLIDLNSPRAVVQESQSLTQVIEQQFSPLANSFAHFPGPQKLPFRYWLFYRKVLITYPI